MSHATVSLIEVTGASLGQVGSHTRMLHLTGLQELLSPMQNLDRQCSPRLRWFTKVFIGQLNLQQMGPLINSNLALR